MQRAESMNCQIKWEGSMFKPSNFVGNSSKSRRQMRGLTAQVLAARPFVLAEKHRAVFDADFHSSSLGLGNDPGPNLAQQNPVVVNALMLIAADERVD